MNPVDTVEADASDAENDEVLRDAMTITRKWIRDGPCWNVDRPPTSVEVEIEKVRRRRLTHELRQRTNSKCSRDPTDTCIRGPIVGGAQSLTKAAEWNSDQDGTRPTTPPKPRAVGSDSASRTLVRSSGEPREIWRPPPPRAGRSDFDKKVDNIRLQFSEAHIAAAIAHYEQFHRVQRGSAFLEQVVKSSAGFEGWLDFEPDGFVQVGTEVHTATLCGLWARQALMAAREAPEWERVVLTVDSGASDTVMPPSVARNAQLLASPKVGTEYEVANGQVVVNLGEKRCEMKTGSNSSNCFMMSFQVVEVHKPLLAVSKLIEAGHRVLFDKENPHILLSTGEQMPMQCVGGTYEIEVWIKNPGFTRPSAK